MTVRPCKTNTNKKDCVFVRRVKITFQVTTVKQKLFFRVIKLSASFTFKQILSYHGVFLLQGGENKESLIKCSFTVFQAAH